MKVLVIGGGGREHALVWKVSRSPLVKKIYCAPGNAGIARQAECVPILAEDVEGLLAFAAGKGIDLTIVGPEAPLTRGVADRFRGKGLRVFGPSERAAEIEGSKAFAKTFMEKYGIPTARARIFASADEARSHVMRVPLPCVVKADGLAAGKGVVVARTREEALGAVDEMMVRRSFGAAGEKVLIEDCLEGREVSALALTDGRNIVPLPLAKDHKRVGNGDAGPNTGGMGAFSPVPFVDARMEEAILREVLAPAVRAMEKEDRPYRGVLYAGLMVTREGVRVLEFNCRFGDPETQPILCRMDGDVVPLFLACAEGSLGDAGGIGPVRGAAACIVMAAGGYPGPYEKGLVISGVDEAETVEGVRIFHAGTAAGDGGYVTAGGRVLGVTGTGDTLTQALSRAYDAVKRISWTGVHYREDIGTVS